MKSCSPTSLPASAWLCPCAERPPADEPLKGAPPSKGVLARTERCGGSPSISRMILSAGCYVRGAGGHGPSSPPFWPSST